MSLSMRADVIGKVISKFDKDSEVKINKTPRNGYSVGGGYYWSFVGTVKGRETRLKLDKQSSKDGYKYVLLSTVTKVVEEIL